MITLNKKGLIGAAKISLILILLIISGFFLYQTIIGFAESSATIWTTDVYGNPKTDFAPYTTVYIHGSNFLKHRKIDVSVTRPDSVVEKGFTFSDYFGSFVYEYQLSNIEGLYHVLAADKENTAQTTFTDAVKVNLDQWANKLNQWVNGDLNSQKSNYSEGESVPFRLIITGVPGGSHYIYINYDFTAGGIYAYDFLTRFDLSESPNISADTSVSVPAGPINNYTIPNDTFDNVSMHELPASDRYISVIGGSITNIHPITHSGPVSGNSKADMNITFNTGSCTVDCTVFLLWGGHLASELDWGDGMGASSISGAPFHMRTQSLDGSGKKNQDRSIQPGAILPPPPECIIDEDCDDDNQCTLDECIDYICVYTNHSSSTPCEADEQFCTVDHCDGSGKCVYWKDYNCSDNDLPPIGTCDYNPDNYHFTWDYALGFISECDEDLDRCTQGSYTFTHTCADNDMNDTVPLGIGCDAECDEDVDCQDKCVDDVWYYNSLCNLLDCFCDYDTYDCDNDDGCYVYGTGCEDRDYFCEVEGCNYTYSNRNEDYYDSYEEYCSDSEIRKHRQLHDFYCNAVCTDHTSWVDDQLVEDCDSYDGRYDTGNTRWVDLDQCKEKEQKEQKYRDYYCSETPSVDCYYTNTSTQWVDTGNTRNKPDDTPCDDGLWCTNPDTCTAGVCGGPPRDCSHLDDQCNDGICNEELDRCEYDPFTTSTPCNNGLYCDGPDHCDATNAGGLNPAVCVNLGPPINCSHLNDQCQEGVCDEGLDDCVPDYSNYPNSTSCELDNDKCTIYHCNGSGSCVWKENVTVPEPEQCKSFYCDPSDGLIKDNFTDYPNSTFCELDQDLCTLDHCDGFGLCVNYDNVTIPSIPNKTVGDPKVECEEDWCDYKITILTPITLSCENGANVSWRYALDGEWGEWNNDTSPVIIYFPEECNHTLEVKCVGVCGESPTDSENFKVEGTIFEIPLYKKWNLISVPFVLLDKNVTEVFKDIKDMIEAVWAYDNLMWYVWTPGDGPDDLETINPGWGYWVIANNETNLIIGGSLFSPATTPPSKNLVEGWNLIGYYGTDWQEYLDGYDSCGYYYDYGNYVYCSLSSLVDTQEGFPRWSSLMGFDNCGNDNTTWVSLNVCDNVYAGKGYWIEMDVDDIYAPATTCIWNENFICP